MNTELFTQLYKHFNDTLEGGSFGTNEYHGENSTTIDFGTEDDISLPAGKYFYAYSDESEGLPCPMLCLELNDEMRELGAAESHQVRIWKL